MLPLVLVIIIIILIDLTIVAFIAWPNYPYAKYIKIKRADGLSNYVAIGDIEVLDTNNKKVDIVAVEGGYVAGYANNATIQFPGQIISPTALANGSATYFVNANGNINKGFMPASATGTTANIGPVMGGLCNEASANGAITYVLATTSRIKKIHIKSIEDDTAKKNLQGVTVSLLDADRNFIQGSDITTDILLVPRSVHHFTYG